MFYVQARELEIGVYYRDFRSLCGITFLKLVDFLDNQRHELKLSLEPVGTLRCEVNKYFLLQFFGNTTAHFTGKKCILLFYEVLPRIASSVLVTCYPCVRM